MAFSRDGLCRIGGSGNGGSTWQYTSADAKTVVANADYFLPAISELAKGDFIICKNTTPTAPVVTLTYIKERTATSITAAAGTTITA
jgi:hypothetical protein